MENQVRKRWVFYIEYDSLEFEKKYNCHAIRKNITILAWLNKIAEEENINFSNVLQMH